MTAQPKPTAADVLREHYAVDRQPFGRPAYRQCTCGWSEDVNRRGFPQHQADMLAAAGLLATAEHDQAVIDEYRANLPKAEDVGLTIWGADTLAEHDAQVAAQASKAADEVLVQIAAATDRQIVGDDVWRHSTLVIAQSAGAVIEAVNDALLDYRDGWAIDEAERRSAGEST